VQGREVEVGEGEISLGRSQSANVSVKDASVSRNHALMQAKSGRLTVKDLNSSNGTFLNGMRIFAEAELHDGDMLTLGESEMRVRILPPESVAATMRIDPRALLAGEELRLQAEEEAKAALVPGAVPPRSPLPPPPSAVGPVPRPSAAAPAPRVPPPAAPASIETGPTALPARPAPVAAPPAPAPIAAPLQMAPVDAPMPPIPAPVVMPPLAPPAPAVTPAPPPVPRLEPELRQAPPAAALRAPAASPAPPPAPAPQRVITPPLPAPGSEPATADAAGDADAFAFPDLDLPPLPPSR
jgi:predicted component of type VI protein secretion system